MNEVKRKVDVMHTIDIENRIPKELSPYISEGEIWHILSQLPAEIKHLVEESIHL